MAFATQGFVRMVMRASMSWLLQLGTIDPEEQASQGFHCFVPDARRRASP